VHITNLPSGCNNSEVINFLQECGVLFGHMSLKDNKHYSKLKTPFFDFETSEEVEQARKKLRFKKFQEV
jgi:hypothetical protein